jgi:predicted RNase H-like HicB family nuclease
LRLCGSFDEERKAADLKNQSALPPSRQESGIRIRDFGRGELAGARLARISDRKLKIQDAAPWGHTEAVGRKRRRAYNPGMKSLILPIVVEGDSDGYYVWCPVLQGCYSQGETYEEAIQNIKDAIRLHLEDRLADGEEIPEPVSVSLSTVEVAV